MAIYKNLRYDSAGGERAPVINMSDEEKKSFREQFVTNMTSNLRLMNNGVADNAGEAMIRQLSYIDPKFYIQKFANLKFREEIPITNEGGWAQKIVTPLYGIAALGRAQAHNSTNFDRVSVKVSDRDDLVIDYDSSYALSYTEMQGLSSMAPQALATHIVAVERALEQKLNNLALFGDTNYGKYGLMTDPTITQTGVSGGPWSGKTEAQILQDINTAVASVNAGSNGAFNTTQLIISNTQYINQVAQPRSDWSDLSPIKFIAENFPGVDRIFGDAFLNGAGSGNTGVMIAMDYNPMNFHFSIPIERFPYPVQYIGKEVEFPFGTRAAGFITIYAPSIQIWYGI